MSTAKKKSEEEALASQKKLEAQAAADAERRKADGGVWKITLEDQAKYEAEHRKKKVAKASSAVSSKAGAAGGGYTPGAYYGGTDASAVKGKAGKTGAGSSGMSTGALKAALRRENDLQTAYRDYVQEAEAQAARQAKTPAMQRLKERKKAEIETAFDDYAENGLKDMYKAALEREVKQAREDEARNALLKEKEIAKKSAENVKKANSSALDKARSAKKSGNAQDFVNSRSEAMGKAAIRDGEWVENLKNRNIQDELKAEKERLKYQWEEAGRRYDKLSDEEKNDLYKKRNSSALERARMQEVPGGSTAQETRNRISNDIYERYKKLDEESRDPANASKYAFVNRLRSAAGEGVENFGLWLYETMGYEPGKKVYDDGNARAIGEVANEQVQKLIDAAPSQLSKDLVKVSDSVAQQLSYKILTAPISLFGGSIIADKVLSKTGSFAAAEKAARDFTGGTYTAGMASSSAADKYVQCRAEGQGKLEASIRAMGTGLISYFSESLGGIGGSKSPLSGLEEKYAESLIGSILYNAFEEGGEEFVEYLGDYLLDGAVDLAARGEWQQEWSWEEVIENAKIGAMSGGLFGGYNKLQNAVYSRIDEANAIRLEKAAREYSDYMKNAYRLMNDPNLREIAERRIGDTAIPSAMRTASRETGEMNFGNVLGEKPGTVSAEQMYGVKQPAAESGDGVITDDDVAKPVDFKSMYGVDPNAQIENGKGADYREWRAAADEKNKKAAEKEATLAEKQKNADNSNLTNREKYSLSEQEATEIKKGVSVITDADNNTIIDIKSNILENIPKEDWLARVKNVIRSVFSKGFSINGEHIDVSAKSRSEFTNSKDSAYLRYNESEIYADKMKTAPHLDIISQNANYENEAANHDRTDNIMSFDRGKVELRIGGKEYSAEVIIGVRKDGSKVFYDIVGMDANKKAAPIGSQSAQTANTEAQEPSDNISSNDSITDTSENFKSKSENSAAKAQQAETEEEARLRTLYESEPENGQKEAGAGEGGTDETDKFIEDTQKRIEDAKITDDKLKEMPDDKQKEVLKDRAERAGLDMDADELVDFAQSLGRIKGFFGREFKDFARVLDDVSGESIGIRNDLHKFFEVPHRQAQAQYTEGYKNAIKSISEKFGELGIKAGSKESAAVQRIGEGVYQIDSKGNTAPYTEEMLKREFPKDWKKIKAAADYCEDVYYDYLKKLNAMYESIYPNTVEKAQGYKNKVLERAAASQQKADNMREVKNKYERDLAAKKELLKKKKEGTRVYAETQNQILNLESKIRNAEAAVGTYESRAFADKTKAELLQRQIDSGEILKNKQIKPRKDYFRHFQEMNNSFQEIVDVFSNDQNISPDLIGKSAETKPRAMWLSEAQERSTVHAYTEDAVGGMLRYAKTAETALAYDPLISKFRDLSTVIRTAATLADQKTHGTGTSAAKLAEYIDLWTNNIAGKSYGLDRWTFDAMGDKGRAVMKAVDKINGNVKGSLVMLNFNTALKQISNIPNATAYIPNPADWARGASVTAEAVFGKTDAAKALRDARSQSSFMNERYIEDTISDLTKNIEKQNILSKPKKFEAWLIGAGDRAAAELIWYTAYTHYNNDIAKAMKYMGRNYDSAIDYADDVTRRSVAGRGRGETALAETSKLMGLVAPFEVETNNSYQLLKEQIGKKNAAGVIALQVNTFLLNAAYTAAIGSVVLGFDFIAATLDVIKNAMGADKDDDVLDKIEYAVGRYGGELLSGMPMGAQIAEIITAGDSNFADKLFGDNNPAKFGNGIALASTLVNTEKAVTKARKGQADLIDVFDAVSPLIGRRQLGRTVKGARSMIEGGVYGYDSEGKRYLKYAQGNGVSDWVKALMMGQYATNAGREYVEGGFKSLSAKDTTLMNIAEGLGVPKELFYDTVLGMKKKGTNKKKQEWLFANDKLTPEQKKIFDALYFGNREEAVAAARKEADLAGAGTNKNDFYDILSGKLSSKRDYSGSYAFENSEYSGKVQGQIRAAEGAEITREQLFSVLAGTKNKNLPDKMAEVYSTEGLTPEQQDKLGDIVLGDDGKGRRESYAAANVSISDRVLMEEILSDYSAQKKQTGDGEADELVKKTFIMDKLMAEGKSKYEAYRLYKIQDGSWANSVADLSDEEKKRAGAAKKQYGLSESDYVIIKNYSGLAEGEKDKYGNTVSGSNREDNIKNLAKLLHCSEEEAERRLTIATGCAYSVEELSSSARDKLETGRKYGWTDEKWLKAANAIELSGVTKKEEKIKVLRDAGFSASEAAGYYNLNAGNDYYSSKAAGTPYGLSSGQYDKTKYWSEKSGKSEKEVAGYFKAIKGLTKKVDIIAALEAAGMSSSEANEFYALRQGRDSGYKAYKNGG